MDPVVYADFAEPAAYLSSRVADRLAGAGIHLDWRAVESDPAVPVTGRHLDGDAGYALRARLEQTARSCGVKAPVVAVPTFVPNTQAAVAAYAEACLAGIGGEVRQLLYELYWWRGADIGSPAVLRGAIAGPFLRSRSVAVPLHEFGYAVTADRAPITSAAYLEIRSWREQWQRLGAPHELALVSGADTYVGADALRFLGKELAGARDATPVEPPDLRPPPEPEDPGWISQVGGRWLRAYRLAGPHGGAG
jgi:hypothetical protein